MSDRKIDLRTLLASLENDPFLNQAGEALRAAPEQAGDSIFSVRPPAGRPAAPRPPDAEAALRPAPQAPRAPVAAAPQPPPGAAPQPSAGGARPAASPSPQAPIRDTVLYWAVRQEVLKDEQLAALIAKLQAVPPGTPPWRVALTLPGAPREQILAIAAHVHKVPFADLRERQHYMLAFTLSSLPLDFREQCHRLGLLPFAYEHDAASGELVLKLATPDPLRAEVTAFLRGLQMEVRLHYAPEAMISRLVQKLTAGRAA